MGAVDECVTPGLSKGLFRTYATWVWVPPALGGVPLATMLQSGFGWIISCSPHTLYLSSAPVMTGKEGGAVCSFSPRLPRLLSGAEVPGT